MAGVPRWNCARSEKCVHNHCKMSQRRTVLYLITKTCLRFFALMTVDGLSPKMATITAKMPSGVYSSWLNADQNRFDVVAASWLSNKFDVRWRARSSKNVQPAEEYRLHPADRSCKRCHRWLNSFVLQAILIKKPLLQKMRQGFSKNPIMQIMAPMMINAADAIRHSEHTRFATGHSVSHCASRMVCSTAISCSSRSRRNWRLDHHSVFASSLTAPCAWTLLVFFHRFFGTGEFSFSLEHQWL